MHIRSTYPDFEGNAAATVLPHMDNFIGCPKLVMSIYKSGIYKDLIISIDSFE